VATERNSIHRRPERNERHRGPARSRWSGRRGELGAAAYIRSGTEAEGRSRAEPRVLDVAKRNSRPQPIVRGLATVLISDAAGHQDRLV
jgi:hypothetical protein